MRPFAVIAFLLICVAVSAREWPLWDNHEAVASYAERVKLAPTKTLELGNGVKLELVLIPAGKFVMGTVEPVQPIATVEDAEWMVVLGAVLTIVLFVMLHFRYRKTQKRHFSLGWLLMLTATVGLFVGGIARRNALAELWGNYKTEMRAFKNISDDEKPAHEVTISQAFYMGKYPITQEQYEAVMKTNPSDFTTPKGGGPTHPVEYVSWNDAMSFCARAKVQLPTEAQWEYACRAGTTTRYYSGDKKSDLDRVAWYGANSKRKTHPVGGKGANVFGLYDMHGNVWQWCADGLRAYSVLKQTHPTGPIAPNESRVVRGGSWPNDLDTCRSACRGDFDPGARVYSIGFRVIETIPN